jgi:hypothetical protein
MAHQSSEEFASANPTKRTKMQGFKSRGSVQRFLSIHAATYNTFDVQPATIDPSGTFPPALTPRCKR